MKTLNSRRRKFFFHYNKPKSKQEGCPIISLHYDGACHFAKNVVVNTPTQGKIRNRQPFFVMEGYYSKVRWDEKNRVAIVE